MLQLKERKNVHLLSRAAMTDLQIFVLLSENVSRFEYACLICGAGTHSAPKTTPIFLTKCFLNHQPNQILPCVKRAQRKVDAYSSWAVNAVIYVYKSLCQEGEEVGWYICYKYCYFVTSEALLFFLMKFCHLLACTGNGYIFLSLLLVFNLLMTYSM